MCITSLLAPAENVVDEVATKAGHAQAVAKEVVEAAELGIADAQNCLGRCYHTGEGVRQNFKEGARWYRKAAEQGDADAQWRLGGCYHAGEGVRQDLAEAVRCYRKAADQGFSDAQISLGRFSKPLLDA